MKKKTQRLPLSARLAGMIGGLFLLFCLLLSILFMSAFQGVAVRHLSSSLLRDMNNIADTLSADCTDIEKNSEAIAEQMQTFVQLTDLEIFLFDDAGSAYLLQNRQLVKALLSEQPPILQQMAEEALQGTTQCEAAEVANEKRIIGTMPMQTKKGGRKLGVAVTGAFAEFAQGLREGAYILLIIMASTFVVVLAAAVFFSGRFVRPIRRIEKTALQLSEGDYDARTGISRTDEVGSLATAIDEMALRLADAQQRDRQARQERTDFLARISHELKTPVTVIRASLEMLDEEIALPKEEEKTCRRQMLAESVWLQKLITALLDLTRLQTIDYTLEMKQCDLVELLGDVLMSAQILAQPRGIRITCMQPDGACSIYGDYDRLRQLVMILIDNAVKYSPAGSEVTLTLTPKSKRLSVQDEGGGIEAELLKKIFDPYVRKNVQHTDGTGLGLAIASEIAQKHGFHLSATSVVGKGSCFFLDMK